MLLMRCLLFVFSILPICYKRFTKEGSRPWNNTGGSPAA